MSAEGGRSRADQPEDLTGPDLPLVAAGPGDGSADAMIREACF